MGTVSSAFAQTNRELKFSVVKMPVSRRLWLISSLVLVSTVCATGLLKIFQSWIKRRDRFTDRDKDESAKEKASASKDRDGDKKTEVEADADGTEEMEKDADKDREQPKQDDDLWPYLWLERNKKEVALLPTSIRSDKRGTWASDRVGLCLIATVAADVDEDANTFLYGLPRIPLFFFSVNFAHTGAQASLLDRSKEVNLWRFSFFHKQFSCFCKVRQVGRGRMYEPTLTVTEDYVLLFSHSGRHTGTLATWDQYLFVFNLQGKFLRKVTMEDPDHLLDQFHEGCTFAEYLATALRRNQCFLVGVAHRETDQVLVALKYEINEENGTAQCVRSAGMTIEKKSEICIVWPLPDGVAVEVGKDLGWFLHNYDTGSLDSATKEEVFDSRFVNGDLIHSLHHGPFLEMSQSRNVERYFKRKGNQMIPLYIRYLDPNEERPLFRILSVQTQRQPPSLQKMDSVLIYQNIPYDPKVVLSLSEKQMRNLGIPSTVGEIAHRLEQEKHWQNEEPIIVELP